MNYQDLLAAGEIALVNIVLSGDNALVIGAAASRLRGSQRLLAIIWGGLFAVLLRLVLSIVATELLQIPLLQLIGGVIIFILAGAASTAARTGQARPTECQRSVTARHLDHTRCRYNHEPG